MPDSNSLLKKTLFVFGASMLIFPILGFAEIYKWTDEDGNVHYTQTPPPGDVNTEVIGPSLPPDAEARKAQDELKADRQRLYELEEQREKEAFENAQKKRRAELYRKNCRISKERLNDLINTGRVRAVDAEGNVSRTTPEEHQARIDEAREKVEKYCVDE